MANAETTRETIGDCLFVNLIKNGVAEVALLSRPRTHNAQDTHSGQFRILASPGLSAAHSAALSADA